MQYCVWTFLELANKRQNTVPHPPYLVQKYFNNIQETLWKHFINILVAADRGSKVCVLTPNVQIFENKLNTHIQMETKNTRMGNTKSKIKIKSMEMQVNMKSKKHIFKLFSFPSKGIPSTPQHTGSHPCTRPWWPRSLSDWSRSLIIL